jgi:hypothetical protein
MTFLVTRDRVPNATLKMWRPRISSQLERPSIQNGSDIDNESSDSDNSTDGTSSPTFIPAPFPCTQPPSHRPSRNRSEDEVAQDIISISSNSGKKSIYISKINDLNLY